MSYLAHYRRPTLQRIIAGLALVGFLAATIGVPVLEPTTADGGKDLSQPFPCQHSACGCKNAGMCWRSCCCHTNRSKLDWAKRNQVKPPKFVELAAAKEEAALVATKPSCCSPKRERQVASSCCSRPAASQSAKSSPGKSLGSSDSAAASDARSGAWQISLVNSIAARQCRGLDQLWLIFAAAAPPPAIVELRLNEGEESLVVPLGESLVAIKLAPDTPPPKA